MSREKEIPTHHLSTSVTLLSASLMERKPKEPVEKRPVGRPRKIVVDPPLPKRPVGRPRIHPVKVVNPNKPKRCKPTLYLNKSHPSPFALADILLRSLQLRKAIYCSGDRPRGT
jgi:hypothetical protein